MFYDDTVKNRRIIIAREIQMLGWEYINNGEVVKLEESIGKFLLLEYWPSFHEEYPG